MGYAIADMAIAVSAVTSVLVVVEVRF